MIKSGRVLRQNYHLPENNGNEPEFYHFDFFVLFLIIIWYANKLQKKKKNQTK